MCGIVGYIGKQKAASILLDGLQRLEYRRYDSAGLAVLCLDELGEIIGARKGSTLIVGLGDAEDFLFLGRQVMFPIALEGALKLKEIFYIHAEGYPAAEMKHDPIALICETCPGFFLSTMTKYTIKPWRTSKRCGLVKAGSSQLPLLMQISLRIWQMISSLSPLPTRLSNPSLLPFPSNF
jgi:glucosamine 6-phosphate synthetase-like amidotransferase/phosphosugar isomerase protein